MLPVFTAKESRTFDERLIASIGLPSAVLMENAARGCVEAIEDWLHASSRVFIFTGPGNNGGDGLAIARKLRDREVKVSVLLATDAAKFSGDARLQYEVLNRLDPSLFRPMEELPLLGRPDILVDALLGTGASGELRGSIRDAVLALNALKHEHGAKILAVDLPTGLDADRGTHEANDLIVRADRTVSMAAPKIGFYRGRSSAVRGDVSVANIGLQASFAGIQGERAYFVEEKDIRERLPKADDQASKFTRGRVLAVCGSRGMTGAAIMAAEAALRSGCGLVNVAVPKSERSLVAQAMPELLTVGCTEQENGAPDLAAWDELQEHIERADTILIGSGLRPWPGTAELLRKIILEVDKPMVIDAGALGALVGHLELLTARTSPTILAPHSGEIARLVERPWQEVERERLDIAREMAKQYEVVIAMKGAPTYTIAPDGTAYVNSTGNSGLATAGSGDVLAGIMAGMLVQLPKEPLDACMAAVYLHGLAGDIAAHKETRAGMTATDVTATLPHAFKRVGVR